MAEYRLSPAAERDLELIWTYTVRQWGVEQADRYLDFLVAAFDKLADSPKTAPSCEFIRQGYRRWGVERICSTFESPTMESSSSGYCTNVWMRRATCNLK